MGCGKDLLWGMSTSKRGPSYRSSALQCIELVLFLSNIKVFKNTDQSIGSFGTRTAGFGNGPVVGGATMWDMWNYWTAKFQKDYEVGGVGPEHDKGRGPIEP
jgi:hypothetical protein